MSENHTKVIISSKSHTSYYFYKLYYQRRQFAHTIINRSSQVLMRKRVCHNVYLLWRNYSAAMIDLSLSLGSYVLM